MIICAVLQIQCFNERKNIIAELNKDIAEISKEINYARSDN